MATLVTRSGKGSPLTHAEVDANFTNLNTDKLELSGGTMTGNLSFGDNDKAIFGAGSDLQIFHDGSNSYVKEDGTGDLILTTSGAAVKVLKVGGENIAQFRTDGAVNLYYDNALKLTTTSTGVDITGTLTSDGLTVGNDAVVLQALGGGLDTGRISSDGDFSIVIDADNNYFDNRFSVRGNTTSKLLLEAKENGDISFYEDTGTTAKFFWDADLERLALGSTNSSASLSLTQSGNFPYIHFNGTTNTTIAYIGWHGGAGGSDTLQIGTSGLKDIEFKTNGSERMRIDSSGNVGIGTSSPSEVLQVTGGADPSINITGTSGTATIKSTDRDLKYDARYGTHVWVSNGSTERMRIDSSGNLLVGTTVNSIDTEGALVRASGQISACVDGNYGAVFQRKTSDGDIVLFRKDGTTVGSIGHSGNIYLSGVSSGIRVRPNDVFPTTAAGAANDDTLSLGISTARWKDLYLSGGVYLGGTGSANKLDDYETGTWTPAMGGATTNPTVSYSSRNGKYTKIGRLVHLYFYINISSYSGGSGLSTITGMPFGGANEDAVYFYYGGGSSKSLDKGALQSFGRIVFGQDAVGGIDFIQCSQMNAGGGLIVGNVTYTTS